MTTQSALTRYNAVMIEGEEPDPVERLRFFCSLAMNAQDWLDVEPFFAALAAPVPASPVSAATLRIGGRYNRKNQPERLVYMGMCEPRNGPWHQFAKVDAPGVVWCEVL